MKHINFRILLVCFGLAFILATNSFAQKIKLVSGNIKTLKGIKSYDIKFKYDSMVVGENEREKDYLLKKKTDWDAKEEGKGSRFVTMWFEDRKELYEPAFIKTLQQYGEIKVGDKEATYTLILKTKLTEGGWSIGVLSHPAYINGEMWIVESADHSKVIAKIMFAELAGTYVSTDDFDITRRIQSAYLRAGKGFGYYMERKTK